MNELFPFAEKMLKEFGEFHPFGGYVSQTGKIVHFSVDLSGRQFTEMEKLSELVNSLKVKSDTGARAAGYVSNVSLPVRGGEPRDAVQVHLEHRHGLCAEVYFVYELDPGRNLIVRETYAQEGHREIFLDSAALV